MALDYQTQISRIGSTLEHLVHEGNARSIKITRDNETVAQFPLTFGVVGAVLAPAVASVGAIAALATGCSFELERSQPAPEPAPEADPDLIV
jgi:hypothetical protein